MQTRPGEGEHFRQWDHNGTNFVGTERELPGALAQLNLEKVEDSMDTKGIKWTFDPPYGAHHGGAWERLIQKIKKILYHQGAVHG